MKDHILFDAVFTSRGAMMFVALNVDNNRAVYFERDHKTFKLVDLTYYLEQSVNEEECPDCLAYFDKRFAILKTKTDYFSHNAATGPLAGMIQEGRKWESDDDADKTIQICEVTPLADQVSNLRAQEDTWAFNEPNIDLLYANNLLKDTLVKEFGSSVAERIWRHLRYKENKEAIEAAKLEQQNKAYGQRWGAWS